MADYQAKREALVRAAAEKLADVAAIPNALLLGLAVERGVAVEPRECLPARLVANFRHPRPVASRRTVDGVVLVAR
jgi:hypothetical protein